MSPEEIVGWARENALTVLAAATALWFVRDALSRFAVVMWRLCAIAWVGWAIHSAGTHRGPPPEWVPVVLVWLACFAEASKMFASSATVTTSSTTHQVALLRSIDHTLKAMHDQRGDGVVR